jgi:simple sugar transport system substrate-binding protein
MKTLKNISRLLAGAALGILLQTSAVSAQARELVLGFSQLGSESQWRAANTKSIQESAKSAGVQLHFENAEGSQKAQIAAIRGFISQKVDVIALAPGVTAGWDEVLKEARDAGIPVIITDRSIDTRDDDFYVTVLGSDFTEEGRRAARWLIRATQTRPQVKIIELQGSAGSAPAIERKLGFEEVLRTDPRYKIVKSEVADFTRDKGKQVMTALLKADKHVDVVYAHNDDMALGAIEALESAGLKPGKDVLVISVDATKAAFESMMAGKLNVTVECNPLIGPQLMELVKLAKAGKPVPKRVQSHEGVFVMETAAATINSRKY